MGLKYDARLDLSALSDALEKRGLTPGGRVQKAVDEAVIRYCDPKVHSEPAPSSTAPSRQAPSGTA